MTTPRLKQEVSHTDHVHYPIEDDEPLAESEHQLIPLTYAYAALTAWFESDPTTWVGADMFLYYEEGIPRSVVAPDVFVVTETHKTHRRNIFQTWVEGRVPELVLEVMSRTSVRRDLETKYGLYERLGVREYWLYDPTDEGFLEPRLQGNLLVGGEYSSIEVTSESGRLVGVSEVLGLQLHAEAEWFRLFDPVLGEYLPDSQEQKRARDEAERAREEAEWSQAQAEHGQAQARRGRDEAERGRDEAERGRDEAERALSAERYARQQMERLLREHGIESPAELDGDTSTLR